MIEIDDKTMCCGCGACAGVCPVQCIAMREDAEGFLYPEADASRCIGCNRCERVCPFRQSAAAERSDEGFLVVNEDAGVRLASSSGGAFTALARNVVARGGSVWGVVVDSEGHVRHAEADTAEGLATFRGSKYVESRLGDSYRSIKERLAEGKEVLFSGTPCEVAGLRRFLGKDMPGLTLVEVACHGVASARVWERWLRDYCRSKHIRRDDIVRIDFRDKATGWKAYAFSVTTRDNKYIEAQTAYTRGYAANLFLRPSCHHCRVKAAGTYADVTLADAWGVEEERGSARYGDDKGVSFVMAHTARGREAVAAMRGCSLEAVESRRMIAHNSCIVTSTPRVAGRRLFFVAFGSGCPVAVSVLAGKAARPAKLLEEWLTPVLKALGIKGFTRRWKRTKQ